MAKPDSIFSYITKKTEKFVEIWHCKICAMLPTKGSSTYAKHRHTHVQEKEHRIVNEYNVLLHN
jgi:ribosomal protein L37AE/L43A